MPLKPKKTKNKFEARLLADLLNKGVKVQYEGEKLPYVIEGNYIPDYPLTTKKTKKKIYIEAKGYFRPEALRKMVAVKKAHPEKDIRIVFYSYSKKYVKWADKHGFPWAVGNIPDDWINE